MTGTVGASLVAGAALALLVACGASRAPMAEPRAVHTDPLGPPADDHVARIRALDDAIGRDLAALGAEPPDASAAAAMADVPPTTATAASTCVRSARDTCVDVCTLGDSICTNAQSICDLAAELPGDAWAADRCNAGKASCRTARERCCGCL